MNYLNDPQVQSALKRAQALKENPDFIVSDLIDAEGNQYVDLVQEGGGVLGIALVGYVTILEEAGIRFFSLAGTSAGAINTMAMASIGRMEDKKSEKLLKILDEQNLFDFVDGKKFIQRFIRSAIEKPWYRMFVMIFNSLRVYKTLKRSLGLNPGDVFEKWIGDILEKHGIRTTRDLIEHRKQLPQGLRLRDGDPTQPDADLVVITSDVTTKTKVEFPRMNTLYWKDPDQVAPARYVRASMSIPGFFYPFTVKGVPQDEISRKRWYDLVRYEGPVPHTVRFVDGGMLSNFPINVFHRTDGQKPTRPTFGVRLSAFRNEENQTDSLLPFAGAMINTMRHIHDFEFLLQNRDFKKLICRLDADQKYNWLNFNLSEEEKTGLFKLGCLRAIDWLETNWGPGADHWKKYQELRMEKST